MYVSLRRGCDCLGIDYASQWRRLTDRERSPWATRVIMTAVAQDGKEREVVMTDLDTLPMWLATIDGSRVGEAVRLAACPSPLIQRNRTIIG
ncbi:MAG TPA: phage antirepressor N-terminal domain-containing protein [Gemmataceae bacterium]